MHMDITPSLAVPATSPSPLPTYVDLLGYFNESIAPTCPKQAGNMRSALTRYVTSGLNCNLSDPIGPEFGANSGPAISAYLKACEIAGAAKGTINNRRSELRQWITIYDNFVAARLAPSFESLNVAVQYYVSAAQQKNPKLSFRSISLSIGAGGGYLKNLLFTGTNSSTSIEKMTKLEHVLSAPTGTFTRFVLKDFEGLTSKALSKRGITEYGKKIQALCANEYQLHDFPPTLRKEFADFVRFKTSYDPMPLERNERWRVRPITQANTHHLEYGKVDKDSYAPSAHRTAAALATFFGAVKANGYNPDQFSLAYLMDLDLISEYVAFMGSRLSGITETVMHLLKIAESLIYGKYGFISQQPAFASKLLKPVDGEKWGEECAKRREQLRKLIRRLRKDGVVKVGRDPFEPIKTIIDLEHPITALFEMARRMRSHIDTEGWHLREPDKLALERDLLYVQIVTAQPLRPKMFREMTYLADNTGNLYQKSDGTWAIRFKPEDFKNENGAAKKPYDVELPKNLCPLVERFVKEIRPSFKDSSAHVFVALDCGLEKKTEGKTDFLSRTILKRTRQFLPENLQCPGFGPHSPRHIVATEYIKNNPGGFQVAADVLHDKLETVLKHYAWLVAEDGHRHFRAYLDRVHKEWRASV